MSWVITWMGDRLLGYRTNATMFYKKCFKCFFLKLDTFVVLGELTDFREKNERRGAIVDVKVSPSRYEITGSLR